MRCQPQSRASSCWKRVSLVPSQLFQRTGHATCNVLHAERAGETQPHVDIKPHPRHTTSKPHWGNVKEDGRELPIGPLSLPCRQRSHGARGRAQTAPKQFVKEASGRLNDHRSPTGQAKHRPSLWIAAGICRMRCSLAQLGRGRGC